MSEDEMQVAAIPVHELKVWPEFFAAIDDGTKNFEVRRNDRGFGVGDGLFLREYDPQSGEYTGRGTLRRIMYVLDAGEEGIFGVEPGFCVLALGHPLGLFNRKGD